MTWYGAYIEQLRHHLAKDLEKSHEVVCYENLMEKRAPSQECAKHKKKYAILPQGAVHPWIERRVMRLK
jgi:hypothetical protein